MSCSGEGLGAHGEGQGARRGMECAPACAGSAIEGRRASVASRACTPQPASALAAAGGSFASKAH